MGLKMHGKSVLLYRDARSSPCHFTSQRRWDCFVLRYVDFADLKSSTGLLNCCSNSCTAIWLDSWVQGFRRLTCGSHWQPKFVGRLFFHAVKTAKSSVQRQVLLLAWHLKLMECAFNFARWSSQLWGASESKYSYPYARCVHTTNLNISALYSRQDGFWACGICSQAVFRDLKFETVLRGWQEWMKSVVVLLVSKMQFMAVFPCPSFSTAATRSPHVSLAAADKLSFPQLNCIQSYLLSLPSLNTPCALLR